jgi:hypothetical protein
MEVHGKTLGCPKPEDLLAKVVENNVFSPCFPDVLAIMGQLGMRLCTSKFPPWFTWDSAIGAAVGIFSKCVRDPEPLGS